MIILSIVGVFILKLAVYMLGGYVLFNERKWNFLSGSLITGGFAAIFVLPGIDAGNMLFMNFATILILFTMMDGSVKHKMITTLKMVFVVVCLEEMSESVISLVLSLALPAADNRLVSSFGRYILVEMFLIAVWIIVGIIKNCKIKLRRKQVSLLLIIALGALTVDLLMVIGSVRYAAPYVNSRKFTTISEMLIIVSHFGIAVLAMFVFYVKNSNDNYKKLLETESQLRKLQKCNYEVMLAKEEETRRFRHDISNHVLCLKNLIRSGNIDEADHYLDQIGTIIHQIQKKHYCTGNEILDAIVNYYIQKLDDNIDVSVAGVCEDRLEISSAELCSIISNPMQNAIEALNSQKSGQRHLRIRINSNQNAFKMEICNSIDSEPLPGIDGLPVTTKIDKGSHGIGLKNVKELVEQINGVFNITILNNEFQVTVILPRKTEYLTVKRVI